MMIMSIRMHVMPKKCREFSQTVKALSNSSRCEPGCLRCHFYKDVEDENAFLLQQEWKTEQDLSNHILSDTFGILLGGMNLLSEPPEINFNNNVHQAEVEHIKASRSKNKSYNFFK
jgi:quinol monooxygenase YgiN